jgi:hypothetical protein
VRAESRDRARSTQIGIACELRRKPGAAVPELTMDGGPRIRAGLGDPRQRDAEELAVGALVVPGELMAGSFRAGLAGACRGLVLHSPSRRVAALADEQLLAQNIPFCAATGGESS